MTRMCQGTDGGPAEHPESLPKRNSFVWLMSANPTCGPGASFEYLGTVAQTLAYRLAPAWSWVWLDQALNS